jgi:MFS family permease
LLTVSLAGFALADSYLGLLFWRVVMGLATAPVLAASYAIYLGFGEQRFSLLSGYQTGFGRAGVVASTAPLALAVAAVGWREAFLWAAGASALAAVAATVVALSTAVTAGAGQDTSDTGVFPSLAKTPLMRAAVVFQGVNSAIGSAILGLWGGPWLTAAYGMEVRERGLMLLAMALAWAVSAPLWGAVADRAKQPAAWLAGAAVVTVALLLAGAVWPLPVPAALAGMALLGAATGGYPVVLKLVRAAAPRGAIVYVATALTAGTMVLVFMVQLGTGLLVDAFGGTPGHRPVEAFQAVFGLLAVLMACATVALMVSARRETV